MHGLDEAEAVREVGGVGDAVLSSSSLSSLSRVFWVFLMSLKRPFSCLVLSLSRSLFSWGKQPFLLLTRGTDGRLPGGGEEKRGCEEWNGVSDRDREKKKKEDSEEKRNNSKVFCLSFQLGNSLRSRHSLTVFERAAWTVAGITPLPPRSEENQPRLE